MSPTNISPLDASNSTLKSSHGISPRRDSSVPSYFDHHSSGLPSFRSLSLMDTHISPPLSLSSSFIQSPSLSSTGNIRPLLHNIMEPPLSAGASMTGNLMHGEASPLILSGPSVSHNSASPAVSPTMFKSAPVSNHMHQHSQNYQNHSRVIGSPLPNGSAFNADIDSTRFRRYATVGSILQTKTAVSPPGTTSRQPSRRISPGSSPSHSFSSSSNSLFSVPVQSKLALNESFNSRKSSFSSSGSSNTSLLMDGNIINDNIDGDSGASRSLWIGNVDTNLGEAELHSIFSQFGEVESIRILTEKECAFVNFTSVANASRALREMQGGRVGNCIIRIGFGKSETSATTFSSNSVEQSPLLGSGIDTDQPAKSLWIGNLSPRVKPSELLAVFEEFGTIESSRVVPSKNCGFVNFESISEAIAAKNAVNGSVMDGQSLRIGFAKSDSSYEYMPLSVSSNCSLDSSASSISTASFASNSVDFIMEIPLLSHVKATDSLTKCYHTIDPGHLREMKRKLDHGSSSSAIKEFDSIFTELFPQIIELATDGFGNTVVQKLIERITDQQRLRIVEKCLPQLASIGVHKNGTWVVQKMLEFAKSPNQICMLTNTLKPFIPALIMDAFGNYVVQGCLRLGPTYDQFVFDSMYVKCTEIGQSKFGARAMRACLESSHATKAQQKLIASAVIKHAYMLITSPNGILLIHWLVDNSDLSDRYGILVNKLLPRIPYLCNQKLANVVMLKVVAQTIEPESRNQLVYEGIFKSEQTLTSTLFGPTYEESGDFANVSDFGVAVVHRALTSERNESQRQFMKSMIKNVLERRLSNTSKSQHLRKLMDEMNNSDGDR
eukprot:Partr_v1_DN28298_c0_g1_i1_m75331 putative Pumilio